MSSSSTQYVRNLKDSYAQYVASSKSVSTQIYKAMDGLPGSGKTTTKASSSRSSSQQTSMLSTMNSECQTPAVAKVKTYDAVA